MSKPERQHIKIVHGPPDIIKESVIAHVALRRKKRKEKNLLGTNGWHKC